MSRFSQGAVLGSATAINLIYRVTAANATKFAATTATVNGTPTAFVQSGTAGTAKMYSLTIPDIPAKDMDGIYQVAFANGDNTDSYNICLLKFMQDRLANKQNNDPLVVSMYNYHLAAKAYFAG